MTYRIKQLKARDQVPGGKAFRYDPSFVIKLEGEGPHTIRVLPPVIKKYRPRVIRLRKRT